MISLLFAAIELLSPVQNKEVRLLPDCQMAVMTNETLTARQSFFEEGSATAKWLKGDKNWRKARPLILEWRPLDNEKAPYKILIGKKADLSDAREWYMSKGYKVNVDGSLDYNVGQADGVERFVVQYANLEVGTTYYWQVLTNGRCGEWACGPKCKCGKYKQLVKSEIGVFKTAAMAPRWIEIEGRVKNMRDLGGRIGLNGRRVKQGLVYRGQGLNDNSITGERRGRNRLTVEDVDYLTKTLGIKTDLDLRTTGETADLKSSPLGDGVRFVQHSSACYRGIFQESGMKTMAENFRLFCNRENYPIYFHCIAGADRTGALAYVLNGVLGVSKHELETDWESTFYPRIPDFSEGAKKDPDHYWCMEKHFNVGFAKYGGPDATIRERIELYLKACGITDAEIAAFRELMLEK